MKLFGFELSTLLMVGGIILILLAGVWVAADLWDAKKFCNSVNGTFATNLIVYECNGRRIMKFKGTRINSFDDFWEYDDFYLVNLSRLAAAKQ